MKEIDFISSLFAMCKTRFANLRYSSSVLAKCFFERKHYPSRGTSLQNTVHTLWFSLLGFWMNSKPLFISLHVAGFFFQGQHLEPWASPTHRFTFSPKSSEWKLSFWFPHLDWKPYSSNHRDLPMVNLIWALENQLGPQVLIKTVDTQQNRAESNFPFKAIFG